MQKLFTEFEPTTAAQWKEQLIKDLKGTAYESLVWKTNTGIEVQPFYTAEDLKSPAQPVFDRSDWAICEYIRVTDAKAANALALNALQNGASGLVFFLAQAVDYAVLLKDVSLEHIYSLFIVKPELKSGLRAFLASTNSGNTCFVESDQLLHDAPLLSGDETLCINTSLYQEAGANAVNELACTLAHLNEYLNAAVSANTLPSLKTIHINLSVGGDFFMEIAKLRALRKLCAFLAEQYGCQARLHLHAQTTFLNKSSIDRYNNMLRSTTEAMSASIGGADSILVLPFDLGFAEPGDFSSRMARNQQLILKDESYLNIISDISAGSYYIETLTESLCQKAWEGFQAIEAKGGLVACLRAGYIAEMISADAKALEEAYREGRAVLVGVNKFQNKNEPAGPPQRETVQTPFGIRPIRLSDYASQQQ